MKSLLKFLQGFLEAVVLRIAIAAGAIFVVYIIATVLFSLLF